MNNEELQRYSRHLLLPQVEVKGQKNIFCAKIMIVGLGGLGSPVAMYLAAAGVGELILVDDDKVELSNLQRQIIHDESSLGQGKVVSAENAIRRLNSSVKVTPIQAKFDNEKVQAALSSLTAVVDCTDSFASRESVNRACFMHKLPLISGAAIGFEAQLTTFDFRDHASPCYRCLYNMLDDNNLTCSQNGVFSPLLGVLGSMQALEALKIAAGLRPSWVGNLMLFDGISGRWQPLRINKKKDCICCS